MNKTIFLDMDGVLVNLLAELKIKLGLEEDPDGPYEGDCDYSMSSWTGFDPRVWDNLDDIFTSSDDWARMKPYPWTPTLVDKLIELFGKSNIYVLSAPARSAVHSWSGKIQWIEKHVPQLANNIILTKHKHLLSRNANTILIDDYDHNIEQWNRSGGKGIIFPQPWNKGHPMIRKRIDWILEQL